MMSLFLFLFFLLSLFFSFFSPQKNYPRSLSILCSSLGFSVSRYFFSYIPDGDIQYLAFWILVLCPIFQIVILPDCFLHFKSLSFCHLSLFLSLCFLTCLLLLLFSCLEHFFFYLFSTSLLLSCFLVHCLLFSW